MRGLWLYLGLGFRVEGHFGVAVRKREVTRLCARKHLFVCGCVFLLLCCLGKLVFDSCGLNYK